jgi:hypothetical protein
MAVVAGRKTGPRSYAPGPGVAGGGGVGNIGRIADRDGSGAAGSRGE